ncbi:hypothetical protein ACS0TY_035859 [Phlomoides rotata]
MMGIGGRARIPLPDGYFGNAVVSSITVINVAEARTKGLGYAALKINDSPRHNVYGNDFGWGKPIGVRSGMRTAHFDGNMTTFQSAVPGGIEVHTSLTPEVMQAMEGDAEFMEAFTL